MSISMEQIVKNLYEAAIEGSVARLNDLIQQDELILERCNVLTCYDESPLHIVAMLGHLDFCSELVSRNPGLVLEVDSRRSSPLHLASAKGHIEIVKVLVGAHPEVCLAYDGDGYNSVHIAAMKGRVNVLKELVKACPDAVFARVKTCQGGSVLHLCVQYYQTEALKFLVEVDQDNDHGLLNSRDSCRNSILHLAVGDKQVEIVEYLVSQNSIDVNTLNSDGLTASDVLRLQGRRDSKYMDIAHFLQLISPGQTSSLSSLSGHQTEIQSKRRKEYPVPLETHHNSLMVVASLIATMAFQAGVNPPSGFDNGANSQLHKAFVLNNTFAFLSSLSVILLLISGLPLRRKVFTWTWTGIMWVSITATTSTYMRSLASTPEWKNYSTGFTIVIAVWFDSMVLLFLGHTTRFLSQRIKDWPFEHKCCLWVLVVIMWTIGAVLLDTPLPPIINNHKVFDVLVTGWMVLTAFLIVLYAVQLVFDIIKNFKSWFK